jgi:hypothetical protein
MSKRIKFDVGTVVWAKMKSYPHWPAVIYSPEEVSDEVRKAKRKHTVLVKFFGEAENPFGWIEEKRTYLIPFKCDQYSEFSSQKKIKAAALKEAEKYIEEHPNSLSEGKTVLGDNKREKKEKKSSEKKATKKRKASDDEKEEKHSKKHKTSDDEKDKSSDDEK